MATEALAAWRQQLRPAAVGLMLAVLTLLYGQGLGILFGINEDSVKQRLKTSAEAVRDAAYKGDEAAIKAVLDKSWAYMKRAHLHAGGLGTTAIALILLLPIVGASAWITRIVSLALGAGGLGYSIYWMWAGFRAPGLGSTGAAKESLDWLALPSSIAFVLATIWMLALLTVAWRTGKSAQS
ncbi:MAG: hypothetical protein IH623_12195 [Verrucomicrobia bacterium]|nr:hypothetical protein [Verrucomicrobiota bacterium]